MHPYLNIAIKAARRAGDIIARASIQLDRVDIAEKSNTHDLVTNIDKTAERDIIETIYRAYPKHNILGEEGGIQEEQISDVTWIIDPLDGTMNFAHGVPHFAVSIGIRCKAHIEHGVIYDPIRDELFTATKGSGAQLNNKRMRVSKCEKIANALIAAESAYGEEIIKFYEKVFNILLVESADVRRTGSAALDFAYVAAGRLDGFFGMGLKEWDSAAGSLLVQEAGGFISDFQGNMDFFESGNVIVGNRKIYLKLQDIFHKHE